MSRVVVLDYGSGNVRSVTRALAATGADVELTAEPSVCEQADGLVVPGVGAFEACMEGLREAGGDEIVRERVAENKPVLGICVGHQVMFAQGVEHGIPTPGIGILPGVVERLDARPLPHMGWNTVDVTPGTVRLAQPSDAPNPANKAKGTVPTPDESNMFAGIENERFYFVHSYAVRTFPDVPGVNVAWATHAGDRFVAAVEMGPLWTTQFHPEKSGEAGAHLLRNWIDTLKGPR